MAYWIDTIGGDGVNYPNHIEYGASTDSDISNLPNMTTPGNHPDPVVANKLPSQGSGCLVIGSSTYYVLDGETNTWIAL